MMSLFEILGQVFEWASRNPNHAHMILRGVEVTVKKIDEWITTATYEEAKQKVQAMKERDNNRIAEIFSTSKNDMSEGVQRAFREELERQGVL
jgi:hypothetical protein